MFVVKQLYDLQLLDWDIQDAENSLSEVMTRLADDSKRTAAKTRIEGIASRLDKLAPARSDSEKVIRQISEHIGNIERRIYSGMVTNPRELEAFQEEKAALQSQHSEQEDTLLEILVEIEELTDQDAEAKQTYKEIDTARELEIAELQATERDLNQQLPEFYRRREEMLGDYPPVALATYDSIRKSRGGHAVALVEREACQGCRLKLTSHELQQVKTSQNIVQCGSCTRIMVLA